MKFTPRELDVITLVAEGYVDKEIATHLRMSPRTVQTHIYSVINKLGARNRTNAAVLYVKNQYKNL